MTISPIGATRPGFSHHRVALNGTQIHYVATGAKGPPVLLLHGFPETWWAFHKLMPLLAENHRVFAVDLRGFGDSYVAAGSRGSAIMAEDLHQLIAHLGVGPVHLLGQDIAGASVYRLAKAHPGDVASFTAVEMGLAGFGLEALADVTKGGAWHIGLLAAPDAASMLLAGHEAEFLRAMFAAMCAVPDALSDADIAEFARSYGRPGGWLGASGLYASMLGEGAELRKLAESGALPMPVLAVGGGGGPFTAETMAAVSGPNLRSVILDGLGHYVALEAPEKLASVLGAFIAEVEARA